jgi:hypothetical protein
MIDQTIDAPRPFPWASLLLGAAALVFFALALANSTIHVAFVAIPFLLPALLLLLARPRAVRGRLTDTSLILDHPPQTIPYADIQGLLANGKYLHPEEVTSRSFTIDMAHRGGLLRIPPTRQLASAELYRMLFSALPQNGDRVSQPDLVEILEEQEWSHGPDQVWSHVARQHLPGRLAQPGQRAVFGGVALSGIIWIALSFLEKEVGPWSILGGMLIVFALLIWLLAWSESRLPPGKIRRWRSAGLVISPAGLALIQGDVRGRMRWDEVRKVWLNTQSPFLSVSRKPGLVLEAAGVEVIIVDLYDRPLPLIMDQIYRHWRKGKG